MAPPNPRRSFVLLQPNVAYLPVTRPGVALVNEVRRTVASWKPDAIAVELPQVLELDLPNVLMRLPVLQTLAYRLPGVEHATFFTVDGCDPRIEAVRLGMETGKRVMLIDRASGGREEPLLPMPDGMAVERLGAGRIAEEWERLAPLDRPEPTDRQRLMAGRIARAANGRRLLVVGGLAHLQPFRDLLSDLEGAAAFEEEQEPELRCVATDARASHAAQLMCEMPFIAHLYERFRKHANRRLGFRPQRALATLLQRSARTYREEYDEDISRTEWRALIQYARNLSLVRGRLFPGLYETVTAAAGCVDGDYGSIVLEMATRYPPNEKRREDDYDHSRHASKDLYFDFGDGLVKGECAYPQPETETLEFRFKRRRPTIYQQMQWQEDFANSFLLGACSWPPEDLRIEAFFDFLRKRALAQISEEHTTVEEFTSSMMDGLDFRETTRNWHTGKLYVRRERQPPGRIGPVVLIWRDYPAEADWLWRTTLYAEHQNESDIVIYCSPLGEHMAGPQITRTEYHGILSLFPAMGIPDLWQIPGLEQWGTCARMLLAGAILLSQERYVAYVAESPPDMEMRELARANGVAIVHLPLAAFSRTTLKGLRKVHILGSKEARSWAGDYIDN